MRELVMAKKITRPDITGDISVSRNILMSASDFDAFELNIIVQLVFLLRAYIYKVGSIPTPEEVFLRFTDLAGRHGNRAEFTERIRRLRQKEIRYSYETSGKRAGMVITGLFSSVLVAPGGVVARVSPEAIPWLLYVGGGVGYGHVETGLFIDLTSVYHKRLYLLVNSKAYRGATVFRADLSRLRMALGVPEKESLAVFRKRCLDDFQAILENKGSIYRFSYRPLTKPTPGGGRPSVVAYEISFTVKPEFTGNLDQANAELCLTLLQRLYPFLVQKHRDMMYMVDIHNILKASGSCGTVLQAMSVYASKTLEHQANILAKILRDRYGIDIFAPLEKNNQE